MRNVYWRITVRQKGEFICTAADMDIVSDAHHHHKPMERDTAHDTLG